MSLAPPNVSAASIAACPSEEDIACFIDGRAPPAAVEELLRHLDGCAACRVLLARSMRVLEPVGDESATCGIPRTLTVGEVINGRYRVDRFLARGGMGEVYEAWDVQLNETIALKTIACTGLDNAKLCARMRAEVQLARRVTHPNVCRILEFGLHRQVLRNEAETVPFFTMEYLKGETLAEYMSRHGRLTELEILQIATQVLDGLAAIHTAGIIHRDLKPENVFLLTMESGARRVVVMDFGLARLLDRQTTLLSSHDSSTAGTPAYMAPEQALGTAASTAWDIYAFGVILFRLASGDLPFKGNNSVALAMARVREPAAPLSKIVAGINPVLAAVVSRCLEREPAARFVSVGEIQRALSAVHDRNRPKSTNRHGLIGLALVVIAGAALGAGSLARSVSRGTIGGAALPSELPPMQASEAKPKPASPSAVSAAPSELWTKPDNASQIGERQRILEPGLQRLPTVPKRVQSPPPRVKTPPSSNTAPRAAAPVTAAGSVGDDDVVIPSFARSPRPLPSAGTQ